MASQSATFNLGIKTTADLSGVNELKKSLAEIREMSGDIGSFTPQQSSSMLKAVNDIGLAMEKAFDVDLNTINIAKFKQSLSDSGSSILDIRRGLAEAGATGDAAFVKMAGSMMQLSTATKTTNGFIDKMVSSMANTARYQIMNSAWRAITGTISQAYGYVKNLDSSLNDIQIVTEKNADAMKEFAVQANNAAKSLGASTTDYTDASLIYYQQGLSDEAVASRTDATMKMANVLGESASEVSDYMTAIWNNFDDGSKSLEYYGDVITNLGAHTASSADEIAEGLSKFASVADTVGLSYEYATASLATVVAETRQSADVVGTAFKTLFARLEDLELGDTLDDGTTLGTYSQALETAGVNIKEQDGTLKDMDTILDELGGKWKSLSSDEQVALAQTVAGTRQYVQLVALMNNWDEVKENVEIAADSTGTLNDKQEIYMQSTEAHLETMKASWEDFYDSMLDTDTINSFLTVFSKAGDFAADFADSVGGLMPILGGLINMVLQKSNIINSTIATAISNSQLMTKSLSNDKEQLEQLKLTFTEQAGWDQLSNPQQEVATKNVLNYYTEMAQYSEIMTQEEKKQVEALTQKKAAQEANKILLADEVERWSQNAAAVGLLNEQLDKTQVTEQELTGVSGHLSQINELVNNLYEQLNKLEIAGSGVQADIELTTLKDGLMNVGLSAEETSKILTQLMKVSVDVGNSASFTNFLTTVQDKLQNDNTYLDIFYNSYNRLSELLKQGGTFSGQIQELDNLGQRLDNIKDKTTSDFKIKADVSSITNAITSISNLAIAIQTLSNLGNIWDNDDLSNGQKILQTITNLTMALPMLINGLSSMSKAFIAINAKAELYAKIRAGEPATEAAIEAQKKLQEATEEKIALAQKEQEALEEAQLAKEKQITAEKELQKAEMEEMLALMKLQQAEQNKANIENSNEAIQQQINGWQNELNNLSGGGQGTVNKQKELTDKINNAQQQIQSQTTAANDIEQNARKDYTIAETNTINAQTAAEKANTEAIAANDAAKQAGIAVSDKDTEVKSLQLSLQEAMNEQSKKATFVQWEQIAQQKGSNAEDLKSISYKSLLNGLLVAQTESEKKLTLELIKQKLAQKALDIKGVIAANVTLIGVIGALAAAAAILIATYEHNKKVAQEEVNNAQREVEVQSELTDKYKETANTIDEMVSSYEELSEKYEDNSLSLDELQQKTYNLCLQYGLTEEAIKSLSSSYEELNGIIKDAQISTNQDVIDSAKEEMDNYIDLMDKQAKLSSIKTSSNAFNWVNGIGSFILDPINTIMGNTSLATATGANAGLGKVSYDNGAVASVTEEEFFNEIIDAIGGTAEFSKSGGTINFSNYQDEIAENWDDIQYILTEYSDNLANHDIYKQFSGYFESISDSIEGYKEATEEYKEYSKENIVLQNQDNIKSVEEYNKAVKEMASEAISQGLFGEGKEGWNEAFEWANSTLAGVEDAYSNFSKSMTIAQLLLPNEELTNQAGATVLEGLANQIDDFNNSEKSFILLHPQLAGDAYSEDGIEGLKDYVAENIESAEYSGYKSNAETALEQLQQYANDGTLDTEVLKDLEGFNFDKSATVEELVNSLTDYYEDTVNQANEKLPGALEEANNAVTQYQDISSGDALAADEAIKQRLGGDDSAFVKNGQLSEINYDDISKEVEDYYSKFEEEDGTKFEDIVSSGEEAIQVIQDYNEAIETGAKLDEETLDKYNGLKDLAGEYTTELTKNVKAIDKYNKGLKETTKYASSVNKVEKDLATEAATAKKTFEKSSSKIDELQAAYKTLSSAVTEYNKSGAMSLDTLQSLLDLNPMYLQYLIDENGQLSLDNESLAGLTRQYTLNTAAEYENYQAKTLLSALQSAIENQDATEVQLLLNDVEATNDATDATWSMVNSLIAQATQLGISAEQINAYVNNAKKAANLLRENAYNITSSNVGTYLNKADTSSSSGGSQSKKDEKIYEDEFDVYHDINEAIDDLSDAMSDLDKKQEHLAGNELAASLRDENKLLEQQKTKYQELLQAQTKEAANMASKMNTITSSMIGMTADIDAATGQLNNYYEMTTKMLEKYNEAVKEYNAGKLSSDKFDEIDKQYENFKTYLENYDQAIDDIQDTQNNIDDIYYQELENNFEAWEAEIQVKLDLSEAKREWDQFLREINTDFTLKYTNGAQELSGIKEETDSLVNDINTLGGAMGDIEGEIDKMMGGGSSDMFASVSEAQGTLKEYLEKYEDAAEALYQLYQDVWDEYLDAIDEVADQFQDIIDKFDNIIDTLDYTSDYLELMYGEEGSYTYQKQSEIEYAKAQNYNAQVASYKEQIEFWEKQYNAEVAANGADSEAAYNIKEHWNDAIASMEDAALNAIEAAQEAYEDSIDAVVAALQEKTGLSWASEQWDLYQTDTDGYYDDVERIYQISSIANKYQELLNKNQNASLAIQNKIKAVMDQQIENLETKDALSEKDIELAEKQLAITEAQIALEEAENAKNQMKLTRDSSGNWTYQYVADSDDITEKEQDVLDANNDFYEAAKEGYEDLIETIVDLQTEAYEKIAEKMKEITAGMSDEQKATIIGQAQDIATTYNDAIAKAKNDLNYFGTSLGNSAMSSLSDLSQYGDIDIFSDGQLDTLDYINSNGGDWSSFLDGSANTWTNFSEQAKNAMEQATEASNTAAAQMIETWVGSGDYDTGTIDDTEEDAENTDDETTEEEDSSSTDGETKQASVQEMILQAIQNMADAQVTYTDTVTETCETIGEDYTNVDEIIQNCIAETNNLQDATTELCEEAAVELDMYREYLDYVRDAWESVKDAVIDAGNTAIDYLERTNEAAEALLETLNNIIAALNTIASLEDSVLGGTGTGGGGTTSATPSNTIDWASRLSTKVAGGSTSELSTSVYGNSIGYGTVTSPYQSAISKWFPMVDAEGGEVISTGNSVFDSLAKSVGEDTTVMVRKGERILSKSQTEAFDNLVYNLLPNLINGNISSMISGLNNLGKYNLGTTTTNSSNQYTIENVTAEFPNANDVTTIQEAIMSLPNIVSQYVNQR